jgi:hypothetical protein
MRQQQGSSLRSPSLISEVCSENSSSKSRSKRFKNLLRIRSDSRDKSTEASSPTPPQKKSSTCPPYSFLDMSDEEEEEQAPRATSRSERVRAGLSRFNPMGAVRQRAASNQTIKTTPTSKAEGQNILRRTMSKPVGLSISRSTTTLFSALPRSMTRSPKESISTKAANNKGKGGKEKISLASIKRTDKPNELIATPPSNALGLHDAYGEAVKLGDHLSEHFHFAPPPPIKLDDERNVTEDCIPRLTRGKHCSRRQLDHKGSKASSLTMPSSPLSLSMESDGQPSPKVVQDELQCDATSTSDQHPSHVSTTAAERYAKYSPPACSYKELNQPRLPRSATSSAISLKRPIRSSSDGDVLASLPKRQHRKDRTDTNLSTVKRSISSQTVHKRVSNANGRSPPPFPPPDCPLPPLPVSFRQSSLLYQSGKRFD